MSYNGSGTFQINTTGQPVVAGTVISSTAFNALTADLATGLSTAITKDGQTTTTARIIFAQGTRDNTLTASSAVATDASKNLVSVTNTGTGNNVLATSPTLVTPILGTPTSGNLVNCTGLDYDGFKNRIINGAMVIDQRNAGASVTPASFSYTLDRWQGVQTTASKFSVQQNAGAVTPPAGFNSYLGVTSLSAYSVAAGDTFNVLQSVEGFNCADLAWGTANAATITLSFWVRSSLTGTFGGAIKDGSSTNSYPFTYTISSANTWEYKTITIVGPTSGQFSYTSTTNGIGLQVVFGLGSGATFSGTAGAWAAVNAYTATGATSVVGTSGATFYITGVQLEKGSTATSFDYRPYGVELGLCQRYLPAYISSSAADQVAGFGQGANTTNIAFVYTFPMTTRVPPTGISVPNSAHFTVSDGVTNTVCTTSSFNIAGYFSANLGFAVASGLTQYRPYALYANDSAAKILFTGCEL